MANSCQTGESKGLPVSAAELPTRFQCFPIHAFGVFEFSEGYKHIAQTDFGQRHSILITDFTIGGERVFVAFPGPLNITEEEVDISDVVVLRTQAYFVSGISVDGQ